MSSSLWVSITTSEVGMAVQVRTQPSAFCSSVRKPQPERSMVPETSLPAQAEQEPALQAYGRSSNSSAFSSCGGHGWCQGRQGGTR